MRRRDWRAGVLKTIARGLQRAAGLLDRFADDVERLAVRVRAVDAKPDRPLDTTSSQPADRTVRQSGQPPAHWLEQVQRGRPPEHWLRDLRHAQVQTIETQRAAETAEAVSNTSPAKPVSGEAHDDHAHTSAGFQTAPAARSVTPHMQSDDRAASLVTHAESQASPVVSKAITPSSAQPVLEEQPQSVESVSSATSITETSAPLSQRSDRVEKTRRVTRFRLPSLLARKGESTPAPVEDAEETKTETTAPLSQRSDRVEKTRRVTRFRLPPLLARKGESTPVPVEDAEETKTETAAPLSQRSDQVEKPRRVTRFRLPSLLARKGESTPAPVEDAEETKTGTAAPLSQRSDRVEKTRRVTRFRLPPLSARKGESMSAPVEDAEETKTQSLASEKSPLRTRPELELTPAKKRLMHPNPIKEEAISKTRRATIEKHVAGVTPAKRSTRGWSQPGGPPTLAVDEQFVTYMQPVRHTSPTMAPAREAGGRARVITAWAPIDVSAPNVAINQATKVIERWAQLEVITPAAEPVKDTWAELPDEKSLALDDTLLDEEWDAHVRTRQHLQRLDLEQRGSLWNESLF
jgi:hypothetical protein